MAKLKGLGRGLDALLGESMSDPSRDELKTVSVTCLQAGKYQPRTFMDVDALNELAESIKSQGLIQPILVRPLPGLLDQYEIIAGERRWRASQLAGLSEVPVLIREVADEAALAMALIENIQRQELTALEEAHGLARLIEEFEMTHDAAATAIGRSRSAVTNLLRLLQLAPAAQNLLADGTLDMGHARALLALPLNEQGRAALIVVDKNLSVRETETLVKSLLNPKLPAPPKATDPDVARLAETLSDKLGARVDIKAGRKGSGKVVIEYTNLDQLDALLGLINRP